MQSTLLRLFWLIILTWGSRILHNISTSIRNFDKVASRDIQKHQVRDLTEACRSGDDPRNRNGPQSRGKWINYKDMTASHPYCLQHYSWLETLGLRGVIARYTDSKNVVSLTSLSIRLPRCLFHRVLALEVAVRQLQSCWNDISLLRGRLTIKNVIPDDCETIKACQQGDLMKLQELFGNGRAKPNDTTENGRTILQVCGILVISLMEVHTPRLQSKAEILQ